MRTTIVRCGTFNASKRARKLPGLTATAICLSFRTTGREGWSVDVEVETPRDLPLTLASTNGGIDIQDVSGRTRFETVNGGVTLSNVSGDMRGRTVNGGLNVRLDGRDQFAAGGTGFRVVFMFVLSEGGEGEAERKRGNREQ